MNKTKAILCAGITFPASLIAGLLTSIYFKTTNPSNIDVTQGLAYLAYIVGTVFVVMLVLSIACIVYSMAAKRAGESTKLPLTLLVINIIATVLIVILNGQVSRVQDNYRIEHGQPTLRQFFDQLNQQKQN